MAYTWNLKNKKARTHCWFLLFHIWNAISYFQENINHPNRETPYIWIFSRSFSLSNKKNAYLLRSQASFGSIGLWYFFQCFLRMECKEIELHCSLLEFKSISKITINMRWILERNPIHYPKRTNRWTSCQIESPKLNFKKCAFVFYIKWLWYV